VLAAPDAQTVVGEGEKGGSARVIVSQSKRSAVFVGQQMPDVGRQHALQLWVLGDGEPRSVGLISAEAPIVAHGLKSGVRLGVTVEPAGGSQKPTTNPIMQLDLA
jgi:anti-sigma-K factor RskA